MVMELHLMEMLQALLVKTRDGLGLTRLSLIIFSILHTQLVH